MSEPTERDHARIWLEPGEGSGYEGRLWCRDDVWTNNPDYVEEGPPTEYVRADIMDAAVAAERERCAKIAETTGGHYRRFNCGDAADAANEIKIKIRSGELASD